MVKYHFFVLAGILQDISIILFFTFYQPVFYATHDQHFPSESEERAAHWVGFGEDCGDDMTHKLSDTETQKPSVVLFEPRSLLLLTIGLHHIEGSFPH